MNKGDLVSFVKDQTKLSKADSEKAINAVFEGISCALQKKEEAAFVGFGSFLVVEKKAREGRNPQTGEKIHIAASNQVKFRPGKALKDSVAI
ncbi:MAG: HU family DNA-binding protein [Holosporales bacterium]|jgi:DNA-binding protein HU-beta|nr:HU family DNA-binding protein [Holosporales bacterium]